MTIKDLLSSPDPANFQLALAVATIEQLREIADDLKNQEAKHRKEFEKAMLKVEDCKKKGGYDFNKPLMAASTARSAQWAVLEKRQAVQKAINEKHK